MTSADGRQPTAERRESRIVLLLVVCGALLSCRREVTGPAESLGISVPYEVDTLDPHLYNRLSNFALVSHFYEPLVTTDPHMTIRPCLASRWDNPDNLTWVFHLRPDVRFHDGSRLTADDVVSTFQRLLTTKGLAISGYVLNIESVRAVSPTAVEVKTTAPMSILLNKLRFVLVTKQGVPPLALAETVNGTGPYRLDEWKKGDSVRMSQHAGYWAGEPQMKDVTIRLGRSNQQAIDDLTSSRSQLVQCGDKKLLEFVAALPGVAVKKQSSIFVKLLAYDVARDVTPFTSTRLNPFRSQKVRRAVHLAIDRERLVARLSSLAVPASQPVPPFIFGHNPALPEVAHDPAAARRLLAEAGLPDGFAVTLHVRKIFGDAAAPIVEMLAEVGIRVDVVLLPESEFFPLLASRGMTFYLSRFGCPTGDASDVLDTSFHTRDPARHFGGGNDGGYSDPEMDRLVEESAQALEMGRRRPILMKIMEKAMDDLVWIPLYVDQDGYVVNDAYRWEPRQDNFVLANEVTSAR